MARRSSFRNARCLVTGASSGLGRAVASRLAVDGARLVLTARSVSRLSELASELPATGEGRIVAAVADLTRSDDRAQLFSAVEDHLDGALDLVINAAGVGGYGRFETHAPEVLRRIIEINLIAAAEVCRLALPYLRRGDSPSVVNVGSIVARRALPGRAAYSASKFALAGLTEALRAEWAIDGIHVLLVNPGFTRTAFEANLLANTAIYQTPHWRSMSADQVADAILRAVLRGRNEVTLTTHGRLLLSVNRLMPRVVDWGLGRWARRVYGNVAEMARVESPAPPPDIQEIGQGERRTPPVAGPE